MKEGMNAKQASRELFEAQLTSELEKGSLKGKEPRKSDTSANPTDGDGATTQDTSHRNSFSSDEIKTLVKKIAGKVPDDFYNGEHSKQGYKDLAKGVAGLMKKEATEKLPAVDQVDLLATKAATFLVKETSKQADQSTEIDPDKRAKAKADAPSKPGTFDNATKNLTTATGALAGLGIGILLLAIPLAGPFLFFAAIAAGAAYGKHKTNERENAQAETETAPAETKKSPSKSEGASVDPALIKQLQKQIDSLSGQNTERQQEVSSLLNENESLKMGLSTAEKGLRTAEQLNKALSMNEARKRTEDHANTDLAASKALKGKEKAPYADKDGQEADRPIRPIEFKKDDWEVRISAKDEALINRDLAKAATTVAAGFVDNGGKQQPLSGKGQAFVPTASPSAGQSSNGSSHGKA